MATGFLFHEKYMWHDTGSAALWYPAGALVQPDVHAENPETKRRLRNLLEVVDLLDHFIDLQPRMAGEDEILRVHTPDYVQSIKASSPRAA
jgi:acetoin utilization deacetylase AcuC-like enzyme